MRLRLMSCLFVNFEILLYINVVCRHNLKYHMIFFNKKIKPSTMRVFLTMACLKETGKRSIKNYYKFPAICNIIFIILPIFLLFYYI